ncbi:hypothetical protein Trydic_g2764 [Trypoxylus dichotomus]
MFLVRFIFAFVTLVALFNNAKSCVDDDLEVYAQGVPAKDVDVIVKEHNRYRQAIMDGKVPGQPRGAGLKYLRWDEKLAETAQEVADRCIFEHFTVVDERWRNKVGQNLYQKEKFLFSEQNYNWTRAIERWFLEHKKYRYGRIGLDYTRTGHYTQMIWAITELIGCGFASYDTDEDSDYEIVELYVCHYGPSGNRFHRYPYQLAERKHQQ